MISGSHCIAHARSGRVLAHAVAEVSELLDLRVCHALFFGKLNEITVCHSTDVLRIFSRVYQLLLYRLDLRRRIQLSLHSSSILSIRLFSRVLPVRQSRNRIPQVRELVFFLQLLSEPTNPTLYPTR